MKLVLRGAEEDFYRSLGGVQTLMSCWRGTAFSVHRKYSQKLWGEGNNGKNSRPWCVLWLYSSQCCIWDFWGVYIGQVRDTWGGATALDAQGWKPEEKLNMFSCIVQGVYGRLRESKQSLVNCVVRRPQFEGISTRRVRSLLIRTLPCCKDCPSDIHW